MKATKAAAVVVGGAIVALAAPASAAFATGTNSGASIVFQQFGNTTHNVCTDAPFEAVASGFAPNRKSVTATVVSVGQGEDFTITVPLSGGSGSAEMPPADSSDAGLKIRIRWQTGSSTHTADNGSYSGTFVNCG